MSWPLGAEAFQAGEGFVKNAANESNMRFPTVDPSPCHQSPQPALSGAVPPATC